MQYQIVGEPLSAVICNVEAGESLITERGSMSWMTPNMQMETTSNGGFGKAIGRMFAGGALFQNRDTAQGGPAMAEYLGIPCAALVGEIADVDDASVTVGQDFVNVRQLAKMKLPCLLTVEKDIYTPRLPSYRLKAATKDRKVEMITFAEFKDQDVTHYGLKGSATSVERIFPPESHDGQIFMDGSAEQIAGDLADIFAERKYM